MQLDKISLYSDFCKNSKPFVVIDCGHTAITLENEVVCFGIKKLGPSETEINTVKLALEIYKDLSSRGKKVILNFCFSDVGYKVNPEIRKKIKQIFSEKIVLPNQYKNLIDQAGMEVRLGYSFQSVNSNTATTVIKKVKKQLHKQPVEQSIDKYECMFLLKEASTFGILSPILFTLQENEKFMLNPHSVIQPRDILKFPLINLKRSKFLGLYDKLEGITCAGTYMGNLCNMPEQHDTIALYSRLDDNKIGEKILAGALSYYHIVDKEKLFFSIISINKMEGKEIFFIQPTDFNYQKETFLSDVSNFISTQTNVESYI